MLTKDDVYSWYNRKDAQEYLHKDGYFGDSLDELETAILNDEFGSCIPLNKILEDVSCFVIGNDWNDYYQDYKYGLFIPKELVPKELLPEN